MSWDQYERIRQLGSGAFGVVYLAKDNLPDSTFYGELVAVKCVPLHAISDSEAKLAMSEVAILRNLSHPNVLKFIDCFIDAESQLCCVTEFVDGGDLAALIKSAKDRKTFVDPFIVTDICRQMLDGLSYLHSSMVLHRDIKPANVYMTTAGDIKIGDFGVSKLLTQSITSAATFIGTPFYVCPEQCLGEKYAYPADIWALGVTIYEMYCLKLPFSASNVLALVGKVTEGTYDKEFLRNRPLSDEERRSIETEVGSDFLMKSQGLGSMIADLVESMLTLDPEQRPTASELLLKFFGSSTIHDEPTPKKGIAFDEEDADEYADHCLAGGGLTPLPEEAPELANLTASSTNVAGEDAAAADAAVEDAVNRVPWIQNAMVLSSIQIDEEQHNSDSGGVVVMLKGDGGAETRAGEAVSPQRRRTSLDGAGHVWAAGSLMSITSIPEELPSGAVSRQGSTFSQQQSSSIFADPLALEQKLREKAMVYHRKRHDQLRAQRKAHQLPKHVPQAVAPVVEATQAPSQTNRSSPHKRSPMKHSTTASLTQLPNDNNNTQVPPSLSPASLSSAGFNPEFVSSDGGMISSLQDLMALRPELRESLQSTAAAVHDREEREKEALGMMMEDEPSPVGKVTIRLVVVHEDDRSVTMKIPENSSYKKLCRRIRKAIAAEASSLMRLSMTFSATGTARGLAEAMEDDDFDVAALALTYLDADGDSISVESPVEWRHALQSHLKRHRGQPMSLRCGLKA